MKTKSIRLGITSGAPEARQAETANQRGSAGMSRGGACWLVLLTAAAVVIGGSSSVFACPVCFGAEETAMIDGSKLGVLVMLGITLSVQGAFVSFFLYLRKRAKRIADIDLDTEWSQLQGGASRT